MKRWYILCIFFKSQLIIDKSQLIIKYTKYTYQKCQSEVKYNFQGSFFQSFVKGNGVH